MPPPPLALGHASTRSEFGVVCALRLASSSAATPDAMQSSRLIRMSEAILCFAYGLYFVHARAHEAPYRTVIDFIDFIGKPAFSDLLRK